MDATPCAPTCLETQLLYIFVPLTVYILKHCSLVCVGSGRILTSLAFDASQLIKTSLQTYSKQNDYCYL